MKALIKNELKRTFFSKEMLAALTVGIIICLWHAVQYIWSVPVYDPDRYGFPESMYYNWLGADSFPVQNFLYYLILPLLVVLPGGVTYHMDIKEHYILNIYTRCSKKKYLFAKYLAVFLSGGVVFVLPLILSLLISMAHFPMTLPEAIVDIGPSQTSILWELFYTSPGLYILIFLGIDFLFAGGMATIALAVTYHIESRIGVFLAPFIIYFGIYCINNIAGGTDYAPNYFLMSCMGNNNIWEFLVSGIIFIGVFFYYWIRGNKDEIS